MKAIIQPDYGNPDILRFEEIEKPKPKNNQLLVRVYAASIHSGDWFTLKGEPYLARMAAGWPKPKNYIPGFDVAGIVEAVGEGVTHFQVGDQVFGQSKGACAEFSCAGEDRFVKKPDNVTFEQAAAVPVSALAALQGLRDSGKIQPGQKVLINGASGGVGTFAVQIAKSYGAKVTGVCSTGKVELVRSLGADHVIDYTLEDFTRGEQRYDIILDNVANHTLADLRRVLTSNGICIPNSGHGGMSYILKAFLLSAFSNKQGKPLVSLPRNKDLIVLKEFLQSEKVKPLIDRRYPLKQTPEAMEYLGQGHAAGKIVIIVRDNIESVKNV